MKKLYFLFTLALTFSVSAQNLVVNPTFDDGLTGWTAGPSTSYTLPTVVTTDGSDSTNSANYVATATTGFYQDVPVTAGSTITISFWYKADGDGTDARIWSNYKDSAGTFIYQDATTANDPLRNNNGYLATATTWTQVSITVTVPADAVTLVLAVRAYNNGTASFDQFSVTSPTASTKTFDAIDGLSLYPNPVSGNVLNITSAANLDMNVAIFDVLGKQVINTKVTNNTVNVSSLNAGVYIVKVTEDGKTATRKLVVK
jgi:hypothetical protein